MIYVKREIKSNVISLCNTMPAKESDIERLKKSYYDNHMLSNLDCKAVLYFAYIGEYKGSHILKWGISDNFARRDLKEHCKTFKVFNIMGV